MITIKKIYILSFILGLSFVFQLQLLSYVFWYLVSEGIINGVLDKYLLLKSPLILIPLSLLIYSLYGLFRKNSLS